MDCIEETSSEYDLIIIGAGITGLSVALRAQQLGARVLLFEKTNRAGGVIQSEQRNGYLLERGPNSYSSFGQQEEDLLKDLGLQNRRLRKDIRKTDRYIWHSGNLHQVSFSPLSFLSSSLLSPSAKLSILRGLVKPFHLKRSDPSLGAFFREVFGDEFVETLLKPGFAGIYAADADEVSMETTLGKFYDAAKSSNSLLGTMLELRRRKKKDPSTGQKRTPKYLTTYQNGLEELPTAMAETLRASGRTEIKLSTTPILSYINSENRWSVKFENLVASSKNLVLATPSFEAEGYLGDIKKTLAAQLSEIPHANLNVLHVGLKSKEVGETRDGFGFLTKRNENVRALGMIWNSSIFKNRAPEGHRLMTCFYGGAIDPEATHLDHDTLEKTVKRDLMKAMKWRGKELDLFEVTRWTPALPLLRPGHARRMKKLVSQLPEGMHLAGNYVGKVSVPDRVREGFDLAEKLLRKNRKRDDD